MKNPRREVEDIERFEEILGILARKGFGYLIQRAGLQSHLHITDRLKSRKSDPGPEKLRETLEELGPTFIKFGQIMSERPDIIPEEYCEELSKLQDSAPEFSAEEARKILQEEIDTDRIEDFDEEPLAAASIAQVHRAKLDNGEEVILKIRRPGIKEQIDKDLDILTYLARKADKHADIGGNFITGEVKEFASWTREELDLKREAENAQVFQKNMESEENVRVPDVYMEMTTEKVMTMEYVDSVKIDDKEALEEIGIDGEEIAKTGIEAFIKQILRDGFLHADPHPSNFLITREEGKLLFIDFGMMTRISKSTREKLGYLMKYVAEQEAEKLLRVIVDMSHVGENADLENLEKGLEDQLLKLENSTIEEQSVSKVLIELSVKSAENGVYLPTKITLIGKGILTMEGIGLEIYPDFKVQNEFKENVEKQIIKNNQPQKIFKEFAFDLMKNEDLVTELPSKLNERLEQQKKIKQINKPMEERDRSKSIPLALLVLISGFFIYASAPEKLLLWSGALGFAAAIYLISRN